MLAILSVLFINTGCTVMHYKAVKGDILENRIVDFGDDSLIKSYTTSGDAGRSIRIFALQNERDGNAGIAVSVDALAKVPFWQVLKNDPIGFFIKLIIDIGLGVGVAATANEIDDSLNDNKCVEINATGGSTVDVTITSP